MLKCISIAKLVELVPLANTANSKALQSNSEAAALFKHILSVRGLVALVRLSNSLVMLVLSRPAQLVGLVVQRAAPPPIVPPRPATASASAVTTTTPPPNPTNIPESYLTHHPTPHHRAVPSQSEDLVFVDETMLSPQTILLQNQRKSKSETDEAISPLLNLSLPGNLESNSDILWPLDY